MSLFSHAEIQNANAKSFPKSSQLLISSFSYDAVTRTQNHKWDFENCVVLFLLEKIYRNCWKDKARIFNEYFKTQIVSPLGISEGALRSMSRQIEDRFDQPIGEWKGLKTSLENTAANVGLDLLPKPQNGSLDIRNVSNSDNVSQNLEMTLNNIPQTPNKNQHRPLADGMMTPPESLRIKNNCKIPKLAFRAFSKKNQGVNSNTEFRAGKFVDLEIPVPPHPSSPLYRHQARRQIARIHEGTTPFISVTSSIIRALHLAFKNETNSFVAVIDLWQAGHVDSIKGDENNLYIQGVSQLKLNPGDPYKEIGEFLIWGEINSEAIIEVFRLSKFVTDCPTLPGNSDPFGLRFLRTSSKLRNARREISRNRLPLNNETGQCVGRLVKLLNVTDHFIDSAIMRIVKDWRFYGCQRWRWNKFFLDGANQVFQGQSSGLFLSWRTSFIHDLKRATLDYEDSEPGTPVPTDLIQETEIIAATITEPAKDESGHKIHPQTSFLGQLMEAANCGVSSEDKARHIFEIEDRYKNRNIFSSIQSWNDEVAGRYPHSTVNKRLVDYSDSDEEGRIG